MAFAIGAVGEPRLRAQVLSYWLHRGAIPIWLYDAVIFDVLRLREVAEPVRSQWLDAAEGVAVELGDNSLIESLLWTLDSEAVLGASWERYRQEAPAYRQLLERTRKQRNSHARLLLAALGQSKRVEHLTLADVEQCGGTESRPGTPEGRCLAPVPAEVGHGEEGPLLVDVKATGGWRDTNTLLTCYQQTDEASMLRVMDAPSRLRSVG